MNRFRGIAWISGVAALMAAGILAGCKSAEVAAGKQSSTTAKVEKGAIRSIVASTGSIVANFDVDIKCKASGEVIKLPVDVSDAVKKGDLLVKLDPVDEQRNVKQADASLSASKARLVSAEANLKVAQATLETDRQRAQVTLESCRVRHKDARAKADRQKELLAKHLASQEDYDTAETNAVQCAADLEGARVRLEELKTQELALDLKRQDVVLAKTQVDSDQISLDLMQQRLKDTEVLSPIDGVVVARNVQVGTIISSGISNVGGGTTVLSLSDLSRVFVLATVDESDIGRVALGQDVKITADAHPNKRFKGKVSRIAKRGVSSANVVTFEVKIEVLSENKALLLPQMTANVEIEEGRAENALMVPTEAISRGGGGASVRVVKEDKTEEQRRVELGLSDGVNIQIVTGVNEGEVVMLRKQGDSRWSGQKKQGPPMMMMGGGRR